MCVWSYSPAVISRSPARSFVMYCPPTMVPSLLWMTFLLLYIFKHLMVSAVLHPFLRATRPGFCQFLRQLKIGGGHHDGNDDLLRAHHEGDSDKYVVCDDLITVTVINETMIRDERGSKWWSNWAAPNSCDNWAALNYCDNYSSGNDYQVASGCCL